MNFSEVAYICKLDSKDRQSPARSCCYTLDQPAVILGRAAQQSHISISRAASPETAANQDEDEALAQDLAQMFDSVQRNPDAAKARSSNLVKMRRGVPSFPGHAVIRPAQVPAAPLLNSNGTEESWFRTIASVWLATVQAYYGPKTTAWDFQRLFPKHTKLKGGKTRYTPAQPPKKSHLWKPVVTWAHKLNEFGIAPAAWIAFRFDIWKAQLEEKLDFAKAGAVPPVRWVMRAESVDKHHAWYFREWAKYNVGSTVLCPLHLKLIDDWNNMNSVLQALPGDAPQADVDRIIAQFFPGGSYKQRVDEADVETRQQQRAFNAKTSKGSYNFWSGR